MMTWKISDLFILLGTMVLVWNLFICGMMAVRKMLEERMSMIGLSTLLKGTLLYHFLIMPVVVTFVLYTSTFHGKKYIGGDDFEYLYTIGNQTLSTSTGLGSHWIFYAVFVIWLCGIAYKGIFGFLKNRSVLKQVESCSEAVWDSMLVNLKDREASQLQIDNPICIFSNSVIDSPFTIGVVRQKIFVPTACYTEEEWRLLLKHELVHCKKKDYLFRRVIFALSAFYWFNPWMEKFAEYFIEVNEMACDEAVLKQESMKVRSVYGHLLVKIQEKGACMLDAAALTGHTESELERRIKNMIRKTGKTKKWFLGTLTVGMTVFCPLTAFAVSLGISTIQDLAVDAIVMEVEEQPNEPLKEEVELFEESQKVVELNISMGTRGSNWIDTDIDGKEFVSVSTLSLSAGAEVGLILKADSSSASFKAGIMDSSGSKRLVQSSGGKVNHTFTVQQSGRYTVFIEGTTTSSINVSGSVTVF